MRGENRIDIFARAARNADQEHVLLRRQHHVEIVARNDRAQRALEALRIVVFDAAVRNRQADEETSVALFVPTEIVAVIPRRQSAEGLHRFSRIAFHLRAKPLETTVRDQVLHTRVPAIHAVAVIALNLHDRAHERQQVGGFDETKFVRQARERRGLAMRHPESAANVEVVAEQNVDVAVDGNDPDIVRVNVHRIVAGHGRRDLEFPREIHVAVERIVLLRRMRQFSVLPDFVVSAGPRREEIGDRVRRFAGDAIGRHRVRRGRSHHVAVDIAARAERRAETLVDRCDNVSEFALMNAVELETLARRDAQRIVGVQ